MINMIIAGIGGQGVITASKIILQAAVDKGCKVRSAETIGMAQRGGSVTSHVRIGKEIYSPFIPLRQADEIIALDKLEAIRFQNYIKNGGFINTAVYDNESIQSDEKNTAVKYINLAAACEKLGTRKMSNIIMLGIIFSKNTYPIYIEDIEKVILKNYSTDTCRKNIQALYLGQTLMEEIMIW